MYQWIDFFNFFFWISLLGFLINFSNFLYLFLYSELTWLIIYVYSVLAGLYVEDLNVMSNSFFVLGFAGIEFSVGFLILILFKKFNINYNFAKEENFKKNQFIF